MHVGPISIVDCVLRFACGPLCLAQEKEFAQLSADLFIDPLSQSLVTLLFSVFLFLLMDMNVDSDGGNPTSAASASASAISGAMNGIPGVIAAVPHVPGVIATIGGNQGAVQIPGFQSEGSVAIPGFQAQGGQPGMQLVGSQTEEKNAVSQ